MKPARWHDARQQLRRPRARRDQRAHVRVGQEPAIERDIQLQRVRALSPAAKAPDLVLDGPGVILNGNPISLDTSNAAKIKA
jgi:hypothetical protein